MPLLSTQNLYYHPTRIKRSMIHVQTSMFGISLEFGVVESNDVFLKPLLPVLLCEAARDAWFIETLQLISVYTHISSDYFICAYIKQNSRRDVYTDQTTSLDK
jgi:hypothetical protein